MHMLGDLLVSPGHLNKAQIYFSTKSIYYAMVSCIFFLNDNKCSDSPWILKGKKYVLEPHKYVLKFHGHVMVYTAKK